MGFIGRLISNKIQDFIINTVEKRFNYNIKAETFAPSGDDSPGLEEDRVYLGSIDGAGQYVVIGHLSISQGAEAGEKILYSRNSDGDLVAKIHWKKDGKLLIETDDQIDIIGSKKIIIDGTQDIEIKSDANLKLQNGSNHLAQYEDLKSKLDTLKQDLNTHTHTFSVTLAPSGTFNGTTATGLPSSTVDFSTSKIEKILVP
jgi:hypothetical protein